jgi:fructose-1,6-bisphosphatase/inositol monophosphatase family enzyme
MDGISLSILNSVSNLGRKALYAAHYTVHKLGESGLEEIHKNNQFDQVPFRGDVEAEEVMINILKELPIIIKSEEHGTLDFGKGNAEFFAVMDGIDGSSVYKKDRLNGRYATMLAIFNGADPCYGDYLFCGIIEHSSKKYYMATRDCGASKYFGFTETKLNCAYSPHLTKKTSMRVTYAWEANRKAFIEKLDGYNLVDLKCTAAHYIDLLTGKAHVVMECTNKGNLEQAVGYGLFHECKNAVTVTLDGKDIGPRKISEFGQQEHIPMFSASSINTAKALINIVSG